jgi:drug/metabolite transporter (DMT)-like permease
MNDQILSIIIAFLGSSINNISQALQKVGLDTPAKYRFKRWGIWILGSCLMATTPFIFQHATSLGGASLVGAMCGSGLVMLTLFSYFVMKEKITANELFGVAMILGASVMIGIFSAGPVKESVMNLFSLYAFMSIVIAAYAIIVVITHKIKKISGIALGGLSGAFAGFITLFQKVTTSNPTGSASIFSNPFFYTWIIIGGLSFLILQFSYTKDKAIRIIPFFAANSIVVPVLGGVICFEESLNFFQWAGVVFIIAGALVINMGKKSK